MNNAMIDADLPPPHFELERCSNFQSYLERPEQIPEELIQSDEFAKLLTQGLEGITVKEQQPFERVVEELSKTFGTGSPFLVRKWLLGQVPTSPSEVDALARVCVQRGGMDQTWLNMFLQAARYPFTKSLINELYLSSLPVDLRQQRLASSNLPYEDWGEAPHTEGFYGREMELAELERRILENRCRVVAVLGVGGIGKTSLAVELTKRIKDKFDYIYWRSLPKCSTLRQFSKK